MAPVHGSMQEQPKALKMGHKGGSRRAAQKPKAQSGTDAALDWLLGRSSKQQPSSCGAISYHSIAY